MNYHCQCGFNGGPSRAQLYEGVDGIMMHCPRCGALLAEYPYTEIEAQAEETRSLEMVLPTSDQCRYSIHLYRKQIEKLQNGVKQLEDLVTKFEILLELAEERERG
jgi:hypothetical protein